MAGIDTSSIESCDTILPLLSVVADREATPDETRRANAHVQSCSSCASHLAFLRASQTALFSLPDVYPPSRLTERIARETYDRPTLWARVVSWLRPLPVRTGLGLAAAALLGFAVVLRQPVSNSVLLPEEPTTATAPARVAINPPVTQVTPRIAAAPRPAVKKQPAVRVEPLFVKSEAIAPEESPIKEKTLATPVLAKVVTSAPIVIQKSNPLTIPALGNNPIRVAKNDPATSRPAQVPAPIEEKPVDDNTDARPATSQPAVIVAENETGEYSAETGRIRLGRKPSVGGAITLTAAEKSEAGLRPASRITENNPFSDGPSVRNSIVSAPAVLN